MQKPPDPKYLAFLASCVDECDKEHSPEEMAYAEKILSDPARAPELDEPTGIRPARKKAIPLETRRQLAARYGGSDGSTIKAPCHYCGSIGDIHWRHGPRGGGWVTFSGLEIDHLTSEFNGGSASVENLVLACRRCNRSKGHKRQAPMGLTNG